MTKGIEKLEEINSSIVPLLNHLEKIAPCKHIHTPDKKLRFSKNPEYEKRIQQNIEMQSNFINLNRNKTASFHRSHEWRK